MLSRVSCAKAASESTANDVFIFPKQWKYKIIAVLRQMDQAAHKQWVTASLRLALGFSQMFGAVFSATLLIETGMTPLALLAVTATGVVTIVSILLFGAKHSKRAGS